MTLHRVGPRDWCLTQCGSAVFLLALAACSPDDGPDATSDATSDSATEGATSGASEDASTSNAAEGTSDAGTSGTTGGAAGTDATSETGSTGAEEPEGVDEDGDGVYPAVPHLIAFGDVHGDGAATSEVLKAAGVVDDKYNWAAGTAWVVQTGDQLDRGFDEEAIMNLFEKLRGQAAEAGGRFLALNGNHEVMMTEGRMDYVFDQAAFGGIDMRTEVFAPGGEWALILAKRNIIAKVGRTVFVHGGVLPEFAQEGVLTINSDAKGWFVGDAAQPDSIDGSGSVVWDRTYSEDELPEAQVCAILDEALALMDADRMVVAHTVQDHVNSICDGRVWRIDTGMADYYGGVIEALEILDDADVSVIVG